MSKQANKGYEENIMKLNFRLQFVLTLFRRNYNISMNIYHLSEIRIKGTLTNKTLNFN